MIAGGLREHEDSGRPRGRQALGYLLHNETKEKGKIAQREREPDREASRAK